MSIQERMRATLAQAGIPYKRIEVYGSQVMITCIARDTAQKWAMLLAQFCSGKVRSVESVDYNQENRNTVLRPTTHRVWRIGATI